VLPESIHVGNSHSSEKMTAPTVCPLCGSSALHLEHSFAVDWIVDKWTRQLGMDVSKEFHGMSRFDLLGCESCTLRFFRPDSVAGSPELYEKLGKFEWYYMKRKWEHDIALEDLSTCKNGIEVGCGFGDFVARVAKEKAIPFEGCEQNPSAVQIARANGVAVHLEDLEDLANSRRSAYDAVCSFQVLEHVTRPGDFVAASCSLLRPGGKLMLGLPNAASFLRHQHSILDMPPHHMSRWTAKVLERLQEWFPLRLMRVAYEPLADYHVEGYVEAYTRLFGDRGLRIMMAPAVRSRIIRLIRKSGLQKRLRGHSIYACYLRT
jgi:2-polyprenyl-3-methyl-5-hydroxy-6-metoxy-1,4-benzoquinol methylase